MKRNLAIIFIALAMPGVTLFISGCEFFRDGDVRVTINLVRNDLAFMNQKPAGKLHIVDRVLRFFSTPAEAVTPWETDHTGSLALSISGEGVNESVILPTGTTSYSTTVPSNVAVRFTVTHEYIADGSNNWGGIHEGVFMSGTDAQITVTMLPILPVYSITGGSSSRNVYYRYIPIDLSSVVTGCRLYMAQSSSGPYTLVATHGYADMSSSVTSVFLDSTSVPVWTVYYKIAVYGPSGEGVLSKEEPYSWAK